MAVGIPGGGKTRQARGASIQGVLMVDEYRGQIRVRSWPKPRGKPKSQAQQDAVDWFRDAHRAAKQAAPEQQKILSEVTAGTPFLPRDLAIMAMAGRLVAVTGPEGRTLKTVAMSNDVSRSLDAITDQVGATLVRGVDGWIGVVSDLAFAGYMRSHPLDDMPTSYSSSTYAYKGSIVRCIQSAEVFQIGFLAEWVQGASYRAYIARIDNSNEILELNLGAEFQAQSDGPYPLMFDVGMSVIDGNRYSFGVGRTDLTTTYAMPLHFGIDGFYQAAFVNEGLARLRTLAPKVGDTLNIGTGTNNCAFSNILIAI